MMERRKDKLMEQEVHEKHHEYIAALIERENQKVRFRQAIIEKSLVSLVWTAIIWTGSIFLEYFKSHWK